MSYSQDTYSQDDAVPEAVVSSSQQAEESFSRVNGIGLWSSWQRNFKSPELALLDLFDNAMDATRTSDEDDFPGFVNIFRDESIPDESMHSICMMNNCAKRIPPLQKVLEVFSSLKGSSEIGENGVGVKQACAALSNLSIVFTKLGGRIQIGFICKDLQSEVGCCLPSYTLNAQTLGEDLEVTLMDCPMFRECMESYGRGDISVGITRIKYHIKTILELEDNYVFLVVMHQILQRGVNDGIDGLFKSLQMTLPRTYLHVPNKNFSVVVDGQNLKFQYWETRLVELHCIPLHIDKIHDYQHANDWLDPQVFNRIEVFFGFDPERAKVKNHNKATLLVYSRRCGRLVKEVHDARGMLGVTSGGTDFAQGLTIIVDDRRGSLPLTPTKQDLAFGQESTGKIHENNLFSWVGALTFMYYRHFLDRVGGLKEVLGREVARHQVPFDDGLDVTLHDCDAFSTFHQVTFTRNRIGSIRPTNRASCNWLQRDGTRLHLPEISAIQPKRRTPKKEDFAGVKRSASPNAPMPQPQRPKRTAAKSVMVSDDLPTGEYPSVAHVKDATSDEDDGSVIQKLKREIEIITAERNMLKDNAHRLFQSNKILKEQQAMLQEQNTALQFKVNSLARDSANQGNCIRGLQQALASLQQLNGT